MNGAESLVKSLLARGVDVCFASPGTLAMHFVAALEAHPRMRCIRCLFEGGAAGAADGYFRRTGAVAATLRYLAPGFPQSAQRPQRRVEGGHGEGQALALPELAQGALTLDKLRQSIAALLPQDAIILGAAVACPTRKVVALVGDGVTDVRVADRPGFNAACAEAMAQNRPRLIEVIGLAKRGFHTPTRAL